jgi:HEPN domain-containing protein
MATTATPREVLERTRPMLALAESVDPTTPGAAGLAYQAAELALHVMLMELDGADPWDDNLRYRHAGEVLGIDLGDMVFVHEIRLRDFYAHATRMTATDGTPAWGPPLEVPDADDCRRCVAIARRVVDAVFAKMSSQTNS